MSEYLTSCYVIIPLACGLVGAGVALALWAAREQPMQEGRPEDARLRVLVKCECGEWLEVERRAVECPACGRAIVVEMEIRAKVVILTREAE